MARWTSLLILLLLAPSAQSADGVIEINQAAALAGGITPGDAPGFPVSLTTHGSFVLTGLLDVRAAADPANTHAIEVSTAAGNVTIDLNGHSIWGVCANFSSCGQSGSGAGVYGGFTRGVTVRNGHIQGAGGWAVQVFGPQAVVEGLQLRWNDEGIQVGQGGTVRGNSIDSHEGHGVLADADSLIAGNVITNNETGLECSADCAYASNVLMGNTTSVLGIQAHEIGGNVCDDGRCSTDGRRRYYLTPAPLAANGSLSACQPGFHFASHWELRELSTLRYDTTLGLTREDSGSGPPISGGWVRTGNDSDSENIDGRGNCALWTDSSASSFGTTAILSPAADSGLNLRVGVLYLFFRACNAPLGTWCIED